MNETLLSVKDVAKYLKINEQTVYRKVKRKKIPFVRAGGSIRFDKQEIEKWLHIKRGK